MHEVRWSLVAWRAALVLLAAACAVAMGLAGPPSVALAQTGASTCNGDTFGGNQLDRTRWTTIVRDTPSGYRIDDGRLMLRALAGDMYGDRATAKNLILQDAPAGAWTATATLDSSAFTREGQQAGLMIYKDDQTFSKVVVINKGAQGRWFEHIYTANQIPRLEIGTDTTAPLPAGYPDTVQIRVVSNGEIIRAEYAAQGQPWTAIGRPAPIGSGVKVGVYAADNAQDGPEVPFEGVGVTAQSDEFANPAGLETCRWSTIVRPDASRYRVEDGKLEIDAGPGEVQDTAPNLIGQPVPAGPWEAETQIDLTTTASGQQAGLLYYKSANNWIKAVLVDKGATSQIELVRVKDGMYQLTGQFKVDVPANLTSFRLRLRSNGTSMTAQYSTDGQTWTEVGQARDVSDLAGGTVGPMALAGGAPTVTAAFDYVRVRSFEPAAAACTAAGTPETGFARLWNGVDLAGTAQAGPGGFDVVDDGAEGCRLVSRGGLGMLWFDAKQYDNFVLRMQWKTADATDNSGVFVRFPNPGNDPNVAINQGHEIQIREGVAGDGEDQKTGSIYNADREDKRAGKAPGQWNDYEIRYLNGVYTITLNGEVVNTWTKTGAKAATPGYIGIQNHGANDEVSFRNIRIQELAGGPVNLFTTIGITMSNTRQNSQINGNPAPYSLPAEEMPPSKSVGPAPNDELDEVPVRMPDTSGTVPNLAAFRGQKLTLRAEDRKVFSKLHFFGMTTDGGPAGGDFTLTFEDGTTETINVRFRDWCATPGTTAEDHLAIGQLSQRYRGNGSSDGARCSIFHVTKSVATAGKKLVSVTLPPNTSPGNAPIQSYLMALTLEEAAGGAFETPDLSGQLQFPDDQSAPATAHVLDPATPTGQGGWYRAGVRISLTGTDEQGGSGVAQTFYRVDGGAPQTYNGPFTFAQDGEHKIEYRSLDAAGNAEGFKTIQVKVDANAPKTTARTNPGAPLGAQAWHDGAVRLTLDVADGGGSGAGLTEYRVNGGAWQAYTAPVMLSEAGDFDIEYRSTDVAGNVETAGRTTLRVDGTAPVTSVRVNGAEPVAEYTGAVQVGFVSTDGEGSGAVATEYRIGDGEWQPYTAAFTVEGNRGHRIDFRSTDAAGNVENYRSVIFSIRAPAVQPTPTPTPPKPGPVAPEPKPFAAMQTPTKARSTLANLTGRRGLQVRVTCQAVSRGTLTLTTSKSTARSLKLKSTTLARGAVRCGDEGRATVTLKATGKVKRALAKSRRAVQGTLALRMPHSAGAATDRLKVTLSASRARR